MGTLLLGALLSPQGLDGDRGKLCLRGVQPMSINIAQCVLVVKSGNYWGFLLSQYVTVLTPSALLNRCLNFRPQEFGYTVVAHFPQTLQVRPRPLRRMSRYRVAAISLIRPAEIIAFSSHTKPGIFLESISCIPESNLRARRDPKFPQPSLDPNQHGIALRTQFPRIGIA